MTDIWSGATDLPIYGFILRAVIVYVYIFIILKVLGQRSLGAINPLDFLFGVIIGDILGEPLSNGEVALTGPFAAAGVIASLHLGLSYVALHTPRFRRVLEDEPIILIEKGRILHNQLRKTKITVESLLMDLRLRDAGDLTEVDYAVLESNGQISVIKKSDFQSVTPTDLHLPPPPPRGYPSVIVMDGKIIHKNLQKVGTVNWVEEQILKRGIKKVEDVFLFTLDEGGKIYISPK